MNNNTENFTDKINKLIDDLRAGKNTRFSGGTSHFDFDLNRGDAIKRIRDFIKEI